MCPYETKQYSLILKSSQMEHTGNPWSVIIDLNSKLYTVISAKHSISTVQYIVLYGEMDNKMHGICIFIVIFTQHSFFDVFTVFSYSF